MTLAEIARLDDVQIAFCVNRRRDKWGNLLRDVDDLPAGVEVDEDGMRVISNPCSYGAAFIKAKMHYGTSEKEAAQQWNDWWADESRHCTYCQ